MNRTQVLARHFVKTIPKPAVAALNLKESRTLREPGFCLLAAKRLSEWTIRRWQRENLGAAIWKNR